MRSKEKLFDLIEATVISFNDYWEDPLGKTELRDNTRDAIGLLEGYLSILDVRGKKFAADKKGKYGYEDYPDEVKNMLSKIVGIVNDGRDLWDGEKEWLGYRGGDGVTPKKYKRTDGNGRLRFENDPWPVTEYLKKWLSELREAVESERKTEGLSRFINDKFYCFEGYEDGTQYVRFSAINMGKDGHFEFDGDIVSFETVNGDCDGDGVIVHSGVEGVNFNELHRFRGRYNKEFEKDPVKCVESFIESAAVFTGDNLMKEAAAHLKEIIGELFMGE